MRCKACDVLLTDEELKETDPLTGQPSDLCSECLGVSDSAIEYWNEESCDG